MLTTTRVRKFLIGKKFLLWSDHRPLEFISNPRKELTRVTTSKILRLIVFDFDIVLIFDICINGIWHCSMVRFKEECPPHRIDCSLGRKPEGSTRAEKKPNETLRADCVEKGWICDVIPIEVGCRGFIGHSVISFFSKIGITGRSLKVASNRFQTTARYASSWIWLKARKFSAWRKYTRNHLSRVITLETVTVNA